MWDPQVELPERRFRTVRFDVRGHGGAAGPPDEYALDNLGRAAGAVLDEVALDATSRRRSATIDGFRSTSATAA